MENTAVREQTPFHQMGILKTENETKGRFIAVMVTHHPESVEKIAEVVKTQKIKTIILEDSPKALMDVIEGRKSIDSHLREFMLNETKGKVDLEKTPEYFLTPRLASYKRRCEILCELKAENPDLKVIILDPYYDRNAVGLKGETYEERMKLQKSINENMERVERAVAIKDFVGAVENMKAVAKEIAQQIKINDGMRAKAVADGNFRGNVLVEMGEAHELFAKELAARNAEVSVVLANEEIMKKVFKEEKVHPPLLQLAHHYITKGEEVSKETA
ncbi:MAG: hypothetical protein QXZ40_01715, partial [Candidatus Micrarchaeia archaeon]